MITPYLPAKYQVNSTDDFISILHTISPSGIIASLDVDSLFTNVPVTETIDIICHNIYQHQTLPPHPFPMNLLKTLLLACTTKSPFLHIDNSLYLQADGVSMGSPLGVTLANFGGFRIQPTLALVRVVRGY